jgi:Endonuclease/Exonuclease/phosphatase family
VKWSRGAARLVTVACAAALLVLGITALVRNQPERATLSGSGPPPTGAAVTVTAPAPTQPAPTTPATTSTTTAPQRPLSTVPIPVPTTATPAAPATAAPLSPSPAPVAPPTLDFRLATFNVLGGSHTSRTGKHPRMASGAVRARWAAELVRRHRVDVAGFQELQAPQLAALQRQSDLEFYPGSSMTRADGENSIGWRRDAWVPVEEHTVAIPYFDGHRRPMPYVKLRNVATGIEAWFANFHNPADTRAFPRQQAFRAQATGLEVALVNRLVRESDAPVFVTGDMNERDDYFCAMTGGAPMVAARGGSQSATCHAPAPGGIDWIFGSQGVSFTSYVVDRGPLVDITTDHPVVVAGIRLVGKVAGTGGLAGSGGSD